jgi:hypothetical protein
LWQLRLSSIHTNLGKSRDILEKAEIELFTTFCDTLYKLLYEIVLSKLICPMITLYPTMNLWGGHHNISGVKVFKVATQGQGFPGERAQISRHINSVFALTIDIPTEQSLQTHIRQDRPNIDMSLRSSLSYRCHLSWWVPGQTWDTRNVGMSVISCRGRCLRRRVDLNRT